MKVGQEVVCINDVFDTSGNFSEIFQQLPKQNKLYIVRAYECGRVLLQEVVNPRCIFEIGSGVEILDEPGFNENRFKPLDEMFNDELAELLDEVFEEELVLV